MSETILCPCCSGFGRVSPPDHHAGPGDRIRWLRQMRGLTQPELAALVGTTPTSVSQHENGRSKPSHRTMIRYAIALRVKYEDLTP